MDTYNHYNYMNTHSDYEYNYNNIHDMINKLDIVIWTPTVTIII